jgi:hypothetical protein
MTLYLDQGSRIETLFERTYCAKEKSGQKVFLYVADITNIECRCEIKCGKFKIGYFISDKDVPPAYHLSRLTQTCPSLDLYWHFFEVDQQHIKLTKKLGKAWERHVMTKLSKYNFKGREIFR